jgi:hypothetical protein
MFNGDEVVTGCLVLCFRPTVGVLFNPAFDFACPDIKMQVFKYVETVFYYL